jgi:hypothetical protein
MMEEEPASIRGCSTSQSTKGAGVQMPNKGILLVLKSQTTLSTIFHEVHHLSTAHLSSQPPGSGDTTDMPNSQCNAEATTLDHPHSPLMNILLHILYQKSQLKLLHTPSYHPGSS